MEYTKEYFDKYLTTKDGHLYFKERHRDEFSCDRTWKSTNAKVKGKLAEYIVDQIRYKYFTTCLNYKKFRTHRIIFCMTYGYMPKEVDHIDCNPLNNKPENLRDCEPGKNQCNRGKQLNNTTGYKGVTYCKQSNKFVCQIGHKNKNIYGGRYDKAVDAAIAYNQLAIKYHGKYAKINEVTI